MHLIIDGYGCNYSRLQNEEGIRRLLDRYPRRIGMQKIAPPHIMRYVESKPEDWGVSGFVLIAESHISIHTFPERNYVNIDVFTCKLFDPEVTIRDMKRWFLVDEMKTRLLERGIEYPHIPDLESIKRAQQLVGEERKELVESHTQGVERE